MAVSTASLLLMISLGLDGYTLCGTSPKPLRNLDSLRMKWRNNMERVSRLFDQIEEVNT